MQKVKKEQFEKFIQTNADLQQKQHESQNLSAILFYDKLGQLVAQAVCTPGLNIYYLKKET